MQRTSPSTGTGGIAVAVRGTGVPVLVLHGTPGGIASAEAMARFLPSDRFRVVTLARPGYAGTTLEPDHPSLDDEADRYVALLDALGIDRVAVLAWSGGGPAAYRFAVRHPDRVRTLVVVAGSRRGGSRPSRPSPSGSSRTRVWVRRSPRSPRDCCRPSSSAPPRPASAPCAGGPSPPTWRTSCTTDHGAGCCSTCRRAATRAAATVRGGTTTCACSARWTTSSSGPSGRRRCWCTATPTPRSRWCTALAPPRRCPRPSSSPPRRHPLRPLGPPRRRRVQERVRGHLARD